MTSLSIVSVCSSMKSWIVIRYAHGGGNSRGLKYAISEPSESSTWVKEWKA
jgi:hypothetical protein